MLQKYTCDDMHSADKYVYNSHVSTALWYPPKCHDPCLLLHQLAGEHTVKLYAPIYLRVLIRKMSEIQPGAVQTCTALS